MMAFLHLYLKYTQPLFVQAIMGIKGLYEAKTVKIHILGQAAEGDLKRPFKGPAGMFGGASTSAPRGSVYNLSYTFPYCSLCVASDGQSCHRRGREADWLKEGRVGSRFGFGDIDSMLHLNHGTVFDVSSFSDRLCNRCQDSHTTQCGSVCASSEPFFIKACLYDNKREASSNEPA